MLPDDLSSLRVVDLKKELTDRNLPTKGKKDELVARLQEWVDEQKANEGSAQNGDSDQQPTDEPMQQAEEPEVNQDEPTAKSEPATTTEAEPAKTEPVAPTEPVSTTPVETTQQVVEEDKTETVVETIQEESTSKAADEATVDQVAVDDVDTKGTKRKRQAPVEGQFTCVPRYFYLTAYTIDEKLPEKRSKSNTEGTVSIEALIGTSVGH